MFSISVTCLIESMEMALFSEKSAVATKNMNFRLNAVEELTKEHMNRVTNQQCRKFCFHFIKKENQNKNMTRSIEG